MIQAYENHIILNQIYDFDIKRLYLILYILFYYANSTTYYHHGKSSSSQNTKYDYSGSPFKGRQPPLEKLLDSVKLNIPNSTK